MTDVTSARLVPNRDELDWEARRLTGSHADLAVLQWVYDDLGWLSPPSDWWGRYVSWDGEAKSGVMIDPRDGSIVIAQRDCYAWARLGDWILRSDDGEFAVCPHEWVVTQYAFAQ